MNLALYFALSGAAVLVLLAISRTRAMHRRFLAGDYFAPGDYPAPADSDYSSMDLGPRIFAPLDSAFVAQETSSRFARRFRQERAGLALEWLTQIRRHTNRFMGLHAKSARTNPDLRVKDEIALGFDFMFFQLTIAMLYCVVWLRGPFHAARLVGHATSVSRHFRDMAQTVLPSTPLAADPRPGDRSAALR